MVVVCVAGDVFALLVVCVSGGGVFVLLLVLLLVVVLLVVRGCGVPGPSTRPFLSNPSTRVCSRSRPSTVASMDSQC